MKIILIIKIIIEMIMVILIKILIEIIIIIIIKAIIMMAIRIISMRIIKMMEMCDYNNISYDGCFNADVNMGFNKSCWSC